MKIVIISTISDIPSNKQFQDLALKLVLQGHTVIHFSDSKHDNYQEVKVFHYSANQKIKTVLLFLSTFFSYKPDIIISRFRGNHFVEIFSFLFKFKWYAFLSSDFYHKKWYNRFRYLKLDKLLVLSIPMIEKSLGMYPQLNGKIEVMPNSFDFQKPVIIEKKDFLLHVGGAVKNSSGKFVKGTDLLIKSFMKWKIKYDRSAKLIVVGDGPYLDELKKISLQNEDIIFTGRINHNDVLKYMMQSKVFVLPSRNEAFGQVFLEAMQYGSSLIGTLNTGAVEIIEEGDFGTLISQEDSDGLVLALEKMYSNYDQEKVYEAYQTKRELFSRQTWINSMISLMMN